MPHDPQDRRNVTLLSVNLNKVALLRNARAGNGPSVTDAAEICLGAGAGGITVHPYSLEAGLGNAVRAYLGVLAR
jgi:Pyridoxal phosphate biosynthesis protein PdxJ